VRLDDGKLRLLEARIDALKMKDKDTEHRKTVDGVFDQQTLLSLYKLFTDGILDTLEYPVSTGKEGNVFKATSSEGNRAVKIYRLSTATFKRISDFIIGDPRFKGLSRNHRKIIFAWAQKEYKNLVRMAKTGTRVPAPVASHDNILVMAYIGDDYAPAPLLKDVVVSNAEWVFKDVVRNMVRIQKARLVHGDLSEYNILMWRGWPYIIDVGQGVPLDHPMSSEWRARDVKNVCRYFRKLGVEASEEDVMAKLEAA
jgi:RIO kinase 1